MKKYRSNILLKSEEEIADLIAQEILIPPDAMNPNLYRMYYDCPCGGQHPLPTCNHILCAFPVKFFINCENNIVTLVHIKGAIKQTVVEDWSCKLDSLLSVLEVVLGDDKNVENNKYEKSFEKKKENKSSKEKTEKNQRSDFKSTNDKSSSKKNTESSLSVNFSLLGKNKEVLNRKNTESRKEELSENEVILKNAQHESGKDLKRIFSMIFSRFPNNEYPIWFEIIRFPFFVLLCFTLFLIIGGILRHLPDALMG